LVYVVWDRDNAGRRHALQVADSLKRVGVRRVTFRRAKEGKDLTDHLAAGYGLDELVPQKPRKPPGTAGTAGGSTPVLRDGAMWTGGNELPIAYIAVVSLLRLYAEFVGLAPPKPKRGGVGHTAICPAHNDHRQSLDVDPNGDWVPVLLHCHAGCGAKAVVTSLGIDWSEFNAAADWYRSKRQKRSNPTREEEAAK
jgi:hypothetical protein